jgi:hypothetical protein
MMSENASPLRVGEFVVTPALTRLVAAVLGVLVLAWAGVRATRTASARQADLKGAEATLATFTEWRRRFAPAVVAESLAWRRTLMEMQSLGVVGDERLAVTQVVGRAAEVSGLRDVRVLIDVRDTTPADARLSTEGVRRQMAAFGLVVEFRGNLQAVVAFLGELPPSVAPTNLSLVRQDGRARHRLLLAVYELQLSYGFPSIIRTPLERDDVRRGGVGGIGR